MNNMNKKQSRLKIKNIPPPITKNIPPPKQISPNNSIESPSIFDSMKQGFGFGFGSSLGHKAIDSIFNSSQKKEQEIKEPVNKLTSSQIYELYNKCLEETKGDIKCNDIINNQTL
jgi:hypothetical protein